MHLADWQAHVLDVAMGERADGMWAASGVDLICSRQNGKNVIVEARELYGLVILGETVIHTAQLFKTARDSYNRLLSLVESDDEVAERLTWKVASPATGYEMRFRGGGRAVFIARSPTSGRGLSGDVLVLDEAQDLDDDELGALLPTISASANPQAWYLGSAPGPHSTVWHRRRAAGRDGTPGRAYFEYSAQPDADLDDPTALLAANPGYPVRPTPQWVAEERQVMSDEMYARERLGISPDLPSGDAAGDFDVTRWLSLAAPDTERGSAPAFGVDVGEDRLAHVAAAWRRVDGGLHVSVVDCGVSPLNAPDRLAGLVERWGGRVMLGGPSAPLERSVSGSQVMSSSEFAAACGVFSDLLVNGAVSHDNQPELNAAVRDAVWRSAGSSGERAIRLKDAPTVGPLAAVVRALWGVHEMVPSGSVNLW